MNRVIQRAPRHPSTLFLVLKQMVGQWPGRVAILFILMIAALVLIGPILGADTASLNNPAEARRGPSGDHWLGTDDLGRDVFSRVLVASQTTILLALAAIALVMVVGYTIGLLSAVSGKFMGGAMRVLLDLWLAFPPLVVAIFISAVLAQSKFGAVVATAIAYAPQFARTMSNLGRNVMQRDYIRVAEKLRVGRVRLLGRHIVPNVAAPLWIQVATGVGEAMVTMSALSFLGLGIKLPGYDWGSMLADYLPRIFVDPLVVLGPALAITVVGIMFSFIGEAGALAMDPQRWMNKRTRSRKTRQSESRVVTVSDQRPVAAATKASEADNGVSVVNVQNLKVAFGAQGETSDVVRGISFELRRGEILGLVGESGSGKSTIGSAIAGLLPASARFGADQLTVDGSGNVADFRKVVATVFQNPMESLTPTMRISTQLLEALPERRTLSKAEAHRRCIEALSSVRMKDPERVLRAYPHELSGGMRQRVMIALGLLREPKVLVADEPTTALDVTTQAHLLRLVRSLATERDMSVIFVSHDMGVIRSICDRVIVLRHGEIVETLDVADIDRASHPYTQELLAAVPRLALTGQLLDQLRERFPEDSPGGQA